MRSGGSDLLDACSGLAAPGGFDASRATAALDAQEKGNEIEIHAFGGWGFGNSDPHPFLTGRGGGDNEFDNVTYSGALMFGDEATARMTINNNANWTGDNSTLQTCPMFAQVPVDLQSFVVD